MKIQKKSVSPGSWKLEAGSYSRGLPADLPAEASAQAGAPACASTHADRSAQAGVTLLEVAVWVSVFTFVMLAIMSSIMYFYRTNTYTIEQGGAVAESQRGIDKIVRVVREAAYASNGAYPIISIAPNEFRFYSDVDADPFIEQVRYGVQGTQLIEGIVNPTGDPPAYSGAEATSTLSFYVQNIPQATTTFRYYDKNGALITDYAKIGDVRFVNVSIIVNVDVNKLPNQIMLRSSAAIRNLK